MKFLGQLLLAFALLAGVGLIYVYSGAYDIAASAEHGRLHDWLLSTTMERSVERRAAGIAVPEFTDESLQRGGEHYRKLCESCHGGPGVAASEIAAGLAPSPPDLSEAGDLDAAEVFWVTKHGIGMTGMPGFGGMYRDDDLWAITAFVRRLDGMSAEDYRRQSELGESTSLEGEAVSRR